MAGWTTVYLIFSFALACCVGKLFKMCLAYVPLILGATLGFTCGSMLVTLIDNVADLIFETQVDIFGSTFATIFLIVTVLAGFYLGFKLSLLAIILT